MGLSPGRITVGTSAVELTVAQTDTSINETSSIAIKVLTGSVSVGKADVTVATGYPLETGEALALDLGKDERVYAVSAASATVAVLRSGI